MKIFHKIFLIYIMYRKIKVSEEIGISSDTIKPVNEYVQILNEVTGEMETVLYRCV